MIQTSEIVILVSNLCMLIKIIALFCFEILLVDMCRPGSSVGIVTDYGLDGP